MRTRESNGENRHAVDLRLTSTITLAVMGLADRCEMARLKLLAYVMQPRLLQRWGFPSAKATVSASCAEDRFRVAIQCWLVI